MPGRGGWSQPGRRQVGDWSPAPATPHRPRSSRRLGVSVEAVRGRIKRNTIAHVRADDRVYVLLDHDQTRLGRGQDADRSGDQDALVVELRDRIGSLESRLDEGRESRRRADTIIAQLTQANVALTERLRELEAPQEPRETPSPTPTADEADSGADTRSTQTLDASEWLPLWAYVLGVFLVGLADPLIQFSCAWIPGNPNTPGRGYCGNQDLAIGPLISIAVLPESVKLVLAFLLPMLLPIGFGYVIGWRSEGPKIWGRYQVPTRFWLRILVTWLLISLMSFVPWNFVEGLFALLGNAGFALWFLSPWYVFLSSSWWIPVGIAFFSGALIGNARRRRVEARGSFLPVRVELLLGFAGIILNFAVQIFSILVNGNLGR
jgi:hypothetical protein